jgi:carbamoylphosphate synthase large subunit
LYKPQLAALFEDNWADFMTVLKAVVVKMMRRSEKVTEERDHKITALMQMNRELENREEQWKERI